MLDPAHFRPGGMVTTAAPSELGRAGKRLWRAVTGTYALRVDELSVLEHACRVADLVDRLDTATADAPLTVKGSMGQEREHPLIAEARAQRNLLARLLKQLALPDEEADEHRNAEARSLKARRAARARWG